MTVNEFAKAIHENAVAHGWYDTPVDFPEVAVTRKSRRPSRSGGAEIRSFMGRVRSRRRGVNTPACAIGSESPAETARTAHASRRV